MPESVSNKSDPQELKPEAKALSETAKAFNKQLWDFPAETAKVLNKWLAKPELPSVFGQLELTGTAENGKVVDGKVSGSDKGTYIVYKDGREQEMAFKNGGITHIKRNNKVNPDEITSFTIKDPSQREISLTKVDGNEDSYTDGQHVYSVKYETKTGKFICDDKNTGIRYAIGIDGRVNEVHSKIGLEIDRKDGVITELKDSKRNYLWQKEANNDWRLSSLDKAKPFKEPKEKINGIAQLESNGDYVIKSGDDAGYSFRSDGSQHKLVSMAELRSKVEKSNALSKEQKSRLLDDYLPNYAKREFAGKTQEEADRERSESIYELSTLLEPKQIGGYSDKERGQILEQSAFHLAHEAEYQQRLCVCSTTAAGASFLYDRPSAFARVMAQIGNTGKFRTFDGTDIVPPKGSVEAALRDQPFPLHATDPQASGVSRIFSVMAANVHWQRRTTDPSGNPVPKGSLKYEQEPAEGVYRHKDGVRYYTYNPLNQIVAEPFLLSEDMVDIGQQITGEAWSNRLIVANDIITKYGHSKDISADEHLKLVTGVGSPEDLDKIFTFQHSQSLQVHTAHPPFHYDSGYGNSPGAGGLQGTWHQILKTKYERVLDQNGKIDPDKSLVYLDNWWNPKRADHLSKDRALSLRQVYNALYEPTYEQYYDSASRRYYTRIASRK